ncbi:MotA/TolQ/ExbB proton channel family protein [Marinimicrobium sp. ARAG 43.8]|uniref:MotA/TolQ/ExbB proton channel family protein n=1 Tax=Marinimicrobium sp. ARAG 43.8 TaxID=3418719 RepID=UPI003CEB27A1
MNLLSRFNDFLSAGGDVLWLILAVTIWLWCLIVERYWFFLREYPSSREEQVRRWERVAEPASWGAQRKRQQWFSEVDCQMLRNLKLITALIALLPMLGLLGTVTGMIQVFDVMAFMGSGNPRAMADGVSAATIPTMAGMVVAILAIPFATELNRRYQRERRRLHSALSRHE